MPVPTQVVDELEQLLTLVLDYKFGTGDEFVEPFEPTEEQRLTYKNTLEQKEDDLNQHLKQVREQEKKRSDRYDLYLEHLTTGFTEKQIDPDQEHESVGGPESGTYRGLVGRLDENGKVVREVILKTHGTHQVHKLPRQED
jgi:hypothetical protein